MQDIDWEILMQVRNMINQDATWNNLVSARLGFPEFHPKYSQMLITPLLNKN